jgi:hypothetical protein
MNTKLSAFVQSSKRPCAPLVLLLLLHTPRALFCWRFSPLSFCFPCLALPLLCSALHEAVDLRLLPLLHTPHALLFCWRFSPFSFLAWRSLSVRCRRLWSWRLLLLAAHTMCVVVLLALQPLTHIISGAPLLLCSALQEAVDLEAAAAAAQAAASHQSGRAFASLAAAGLLADNLAEQLAALGVDDVASAADAAPAWVSGL